MLFSIRSNCSLSSETHAESGKHASLQTDREGLIRNRLIRTTEINLIIQLDLRSNGRFKKTKKSDFYNVITTGIIRLQRVIHQLFYAGQIEQWWSRTCLFAIPGVKMEICCQHASCLFQLPPHVHYNIFHLLNCFFD